MKQGVIYVASGLQHQRSLREEMSLSIDSLRRHNPGIHVTLFTDATEPGELAVDQLQPLPALPDRLMLNQQNVGFSEWSRIFIRKVWSMLHAPYERTLFLDCDTYVCGSINPLFDGLSGHDLMLTHSPKINWQVRPPVFEACENEQAYNTGVLSYRRNKRVQQFLEKWLILTVHLLNHDARAHDQSAFRMEHLQSEGLNVKIAPNTIFNARINFRGFARALVEQGLLQDVVILHAHSCERPGVQQFFAFVDQYKAAAASGNEPPSLPADILDTDLPALSI